MLLFPLLPHHIARQIAESATSASLATLAKSAALEHGAVNYTPTGGTRVSKAALSELREGILKIASTNAYPEAPSQQQAADFDACAAVLLAQQMQLPAAEAAKGGVWEFMSCILLPDLVRWRFSVSGGATSIDRFVSGRRNAYQRLWWRAFHLSPTKHSLLRSLGEDELVQLMERPSLAGVEGLAAVIGEGLLAASVRYPLLTRRQLIREVQKRLLRLSSFVALEALPTEEVVRHVEAAFALVASTLTPAAVSG